MAHAKEKYYKPDTLVEVPANVGNAGYAAEFPDGTGDGFIRTDIEKDVIIQRISRDLYSNPMSGIRELYANEARACRQASGLARIRTSRWALIFARGS